MMLYQNTSVYCRGGFSHEYFKYLSNIVEEFYEKYIRRFRTYYNSEISFKLRNSSDFDQLKGLVINILEKYYPDFSESRYGLNNIDNSDDLLEFIVDNSSFREAFVDPIIITEPYKFGFKYLPSSQFLFILAQLHDINDSFSNGLNYELSNMIKYPPIFNHITFSKCVYSEGVSSLINDIIDNDLNYTIRSMSDALHLIENENGIYRREFIEYLMMFLLWFNFKTKTFIHYDKNHIKFYI